MSTIKRITLAGAILLLVLAACAPVPPAGEQQAPESPAAGEAEEGERLNEEGTIEGQIFIGPSCAVQQEGQACEDQPYPAALEVLDQAGKPLYLIETNQVGEFSLSLAPGTYTLQAGNLVDLEAQEAADPSVPQSIRYPRAEPVVVTVEANQIIEVTIHFDTGVR